MSFTNCCQINARTFMLILHYFDMSIYSRQNSNNLVQENLKCTLRILYVTVFITKQFTLKHIHSFKKANTPAYIVNCAAVNTTMGHIYLKGYIRIYNIWYVYQYLNSLCCHFFTLSTQLAHLKDHPVVK